MKKYIKPELDVLKFETTETIMVSGINPFDIGSDYSTAGEVGNPFSWLSGGTHD